MSAHNWGGGVKSDSPEIAEGAAVEYGTGDGKETRVGVKHMNARDWFSISAFSEGDDSRAVVNIYDEIGDSGWGGVSARGLSEQIAAVEAEVIEVHLNSPGGAAWDGVTIMNALRAHPARVEVVVDGLAASAASCIAMAGDVVTMARGAMMMIHDASGGAYGNAAYLEETAGVLHKLSDSYADVYAAKAGGDRAYWRGLMKAETWYTAEEAVEAGLADSWHDAPVDDPGPEMSAVFDVRSRYKLAARSRFWPPLKVEISDAAPVSIKLPVSTEPGTPNREENAVAYSDLTAGLRERLGMTDAAATDETLLAALDEALAEQADTTTSPTVVPGGAVVIDAAALDELRTNAELGVAARSEQISARRDSIISAALAEGRIAASSREMWRAQLDRDEPGVTDLLTSFPANTVPVAEVGHSDTLTSTEDALYAKAWGDEEKGA